MTGVPVYWYVEPDDGSLPFEAVPEDLRNVVPTPAVGDDGATLIDPKTGEVYGEAILMARLPWPRFRDFATGKEVRLPAGVAETLKGLDDELSMSGLLDVRQHCLCKIKCRSGHNRVEIGDRVFLSFHCDGSFVSSGR